MKKTQPVGMGSVAYEDDVTAPKITRPSLLNGPTAANRMILGVIKSLLPDPGEKYEWDVAMEYNIHMMSQRIGLRLRTKYISVDDEAVDIYSVHECYHPEKLINEPLYVKAVVDKLVGSLVRELARKLKEKHDVSNQEKRTYSEIPRRSALVREGSSSDSEILASYFQGKDHAGDAAWPVGFGVSESYGSSRSGLSDPAGESVTSVSIDAGGGDFSGGGGGSAW